MVFCRQSSGNLHGRRRICNWLVVNAVNASLLPLSTRIFRRGKLARDDSRTC
jgi:hypothetical protein